MLIGKGGMDRQLDNPDLLLTPDRQALSKKTDQQWYSILVRYSTPSSASSSEATALQQFTNPTRIIKSFTNITNDVS